MKPVLILSTFYLLPKKKLVKIHIKTLARLEEVLAREIEEIGGQDIEIGKRIVSFEGSMKQVYRANYELRTAIRVLIPIQSFKARDERELYQNVGKIDWTEYMEVNQTFAIDSVVHNTPAFNHTKYAAFKAKDAIVDQFREKFGRRPNVNVDQPDLRLNLYISNGQASMAVDSSGDSLHKRNYRTQTGPAPINEVLAAGLVMLSGWKGDRLFLDPMCGTGTILIEAASYAWNMPPQLNRKEFGFMKWPNFDRKLWKEVVEKAKSRIKDSGPVIMGSDKDFKSIKIAEQNIEAAGMEGKIQVQRKKFEKLTPPEGPGMLIMNPPYDERLGIDDIGALYKMIGDQLKQNYAGFEAWVISSNKEAFKQVGLRASKKMKLYNGPLECRYQRYEMYEGSKKQK
jgi:putative N6-adenine-specific DNA methylase